ncbi:unnamed protein product [Dibothriocephalus latus]|uniref:PPPDE domain-containing protein n=1 Tax=Dibothriocephalus latus TaxID=60516 RepID=A0A3P7M360_DIBLA|nr:unnamed protein product [Dibothriocephalus latus]
MADVYLCIYDMSHGFSRAFSQLLTGRQFDGIWHTGVVVRDTEYFFGAEGIGRCKPGDANVNGIRCQLVERKIMGQTSLSESELQAYLDELVKTTFRPGSYNTLRHNCNTFSAHVIKHLTGNSIPSYLTDLPSDVLQTPIGPLVQLITEGKVDITGPTASRSSNEKAATLLDEVKPVLYDEPLCSEYSGKSLDALFSSPRADLASQWASEALKKLRSLTLPVLPKDNCDTDTYCLLRFNRFATFRQCDAICEIFRLAVWRFPEFLNGLFTDPLKNLHGLADTYPPEKGKASHSEYFNLDTSKARLLCNCIGLSPKSLTSSLQLDPLVQLCIRLIGLDSSELDLKFRSPEHELAGISLSLNLSLCLFMQDSDALELAASLFHLIDMKRNFKHPTEACYVLRTTYVLVKRFDDIASLAKALNVGEHVSELLNQAEDAFDADATAKSNNSHLNSVEIDRRIAAELSAMLN